MSRYFAIVVGATIALSATAACAQSGSRRTVPHAHDRPALAPRASAVGPSAATTRPRLPTSARSFGPTTAFRPGQAPVGRTARSGLSTTGAARMHGTGHATQFNTLPGRFSR